MVTVNTSSMLMTASGLFPLERALAAGVKVIALMSHVTDNDDSDHYSNALNSAAVNV